MKIIIKKSSLVAVLLTIFSASVLATFNPKHLKQRAELDGLGYKTANLECLSALTNHVALQQLPGFYRVAVPEFLGISHHNVRHFLLSNGLDINQEWELLVKNNVTEDDTQNGKLSPDFIEALAVLAKKIKTVFEQSVSRAARLDVRMTRFIKSIAQEKAFCTVRSTGFEDTDTLANAGGNESIEIVQPSLENVLRAMGRVAASYYSEKSFKQREAAGDERLFSLPPLAILLQKVVGEFNGDFVVSAVGYTQEVHGRTDGTSMIQYTYGHGKAVVENLFPVDTSFVDDQTIYSVIKNKNQRLCPLIDQNGHFGLLTIANQKVLSSKQALDDVTLRAVHMVLQVIQSYYQKPMDVELVVNLTKNIIYLVQARPIVYYVPDQEPSYVTTPSLFTSDQKIAGEKIQESGGSVRLITNKNSILVASTLEEALDQCNAGIVDITAIQAVVVERNATTTSHAGATFSGLGKIIIQHEHLDRLRSWLNQQNLKLLVDAQRGTLFHIETNNIETNNVFFGKTGKTIEEFLLSGLLTKGRLAHPVPQQLSVSPLYQDIIIDELGHDFSPEKSLQELLMILKEGSQIEARDALISIVTRSAQEIKYRNLAIKHTAQTAQFQATAAKKALTKIIPVIAHMTKLVSVIEKRLSLSPQNPQRLLAINFLEALLFQEEHDGVINRFSIQSALDAYKTDVRFVNDEIKPLVNQKSLPKKILNDARLINVIKMGTQAALERSLAQEWTIFVGNLSEVLNSQELENFVHMITHLEELGALSLWIHMIFLPTMREQSLYIQDYYHAFYDEYKQAERLLQGLYEKKQQLAQFDGTAWAEPARFAKQLAFFDEQFTTYFRSPEFCHILTADNNMLVKIVAFSLMEQFVDVFDKSIKTVKSSTQYDCKEKPKYFKKIVSTFLALFETWVDFVPSNAFVYHSSWPLQDYKKKLTELYGAMEPIAKNLMPSKSFNVAAAAFGSATAFERHYPETLEDVFTTVHQNLLRCIAGFSHNIYTQYRGYWETDPLLKQVLCTVMPTARLKANIDKATNVIKRMGALAKEGALAICANVAHVLRFRALHLYIQQQRGVPVVSAESEKKLALTGIRLGKGSVEYVFNYPLRNHSAAFHVVQDKNKPNILLQCKFYGQRLGRWNNINTTAQLMQHFGDFDVSDTVINEQGIAFTLKLAKDADCSKLKVYLDAFIELANENGLDNKLRDKFMASLGNDFSKIKRLFVFLSSGHDSDIANQIFDTRFYESLISSADADTIRFIIDLAFRQENFNLCENLVKNISRIDVALHDKIICMTVSVIFKIQNGIPSQRIKDVVQSLLAQGYQSQLLDVTYQEIRQITGDPALNIRDYLRSFPEGDLDITNMIDAVTKKLERVR